MSDYYTELCEKAHPSIANAEFSVRTLRCVLSWRPNITLDELTPMSKASLMKIPGLGEKSVREIKEACEYALAPRLPFPPPKSLQERQVEALESIARSLAAATQPIAEFTEKKD